MKKKSFELPKVHRLRGQIGDFLLMLNTPEDAVSELIENAGENGKAAI